MSPDSDFEPELDEITLESILAEYKGSAYIDGDKKTPPEVLNAKAERIVMEVTGMNRSEAGFGVPESREEPPEPEDAEPEKDERQIVTGYDDNEGAYASPLEPEHGSVSILQRMREIDDMYDNAEKLQGRPETDETRVQSGSRLRAVGARQPEPAQEPERPAEEWIAPEKLTSVDTYIADDTVAEPETEEKPRPGLLERIRNLWNDDEDDDDEDDEYDEPTESADVQPPIDPAYVKADAEIIRENPAAEPGPRLVQPVPADGEPGGARTHREKKPKPEPKPEPVYEEPELKEAGRRFAQQCNSVSLKSFIAVLLSILSAIFTLILDGGGKLPFGIGDGAAASGVLLIIQLIVIALCIRIAVRGAVDIIRLEPGAESLILVSGIITGLSAVMSILSPVKYPETPLCCVSAFAFSFALWGEKLHLKGITESLKTAVSASEPFGVTAEHSVEIDRVVLRKTPGKTEGFYNSLVAADISEIIYKVAAPLFIVGSIVLAFLASVGHSRSGYFLHIFAILLAAGASYSALLCFSVPFASVAKRIRRSGAAVAGWGGADDIYYSDGACIKDEDVFPTGTVSFEGMKIYEGESPEKAIRYTASLIIASGSGLTKLFSALMSKQGLSLARVDGFQCYEGGIGGTVKGDAVIVGTAAFMNLRGVRVPESMNMKNSAFTAVNGHLVAVFAVNYEPVNSVQGSLIALIRAKVKLFFAARDFGVTPLMLEKKFKTPLDNVEYLSVSDSYTISADSKEKSAGAAAVLCREGLGPFGQAITGARRLRAAALLASAVSVVTASIGVLIMFYLCWQGAFASAGSVNLLLYMLLTFILDMIVASTVNYRR